MGTSFVCRSPGPAVLGGALTIAVLMAAGLANGGGCPSGRDLMVIGTRVFLRSSSGLEAYSSETAACGSCHDGTVARAFTSITGGGGLSQASRVEMAATSHPVDVVYPASDPRYVPLPDLDPRLRLTNGSLTCTTCHRKDREGRLELALTLDHSRLCLACHRK